MVTSSYGSEQCSQQQEIIVWLLRGAGKLHGSVHNLMQVRLQKKIKQSRYSVMWKLQNCLEPTSRQPVLIKLSPEIVGKREKDNFLKILLNKYYLILLKCLSHSDLKL